MCSYYGSSNGSVRRQPDAAFCRDFSVCGYIIVRSKRGQSGMGSFAKNSQSRPGGRLYGRHKGPGCSHIIDYELGGKWRRKLAVFWKLLLQ